MEKIGNSGRSKGGSVPLDWVLYGLGVVVTTVLFGFASGLLALALGVLLAVASDVLATSRRS